MTYFGVYDMGTVDKIYRLGMYQPRLLASTSSPYISC